mmetsp:Transcript_22032/g.27066  ORF Transcript_22032/g.27066 Transcript_22032/m.27066 type:complete len:91 (+) Transcript_22032:572-844(+)
MTLSFIRPFATGSATEDVQLDVESNQGFDVFGTFTKIDTRNGSRVRKVSEPVTATLISAPLIDLVGLPEGVEDLYDPEPEKYEFAEKKWW